MLVQNQSKSWLKKVHEEGSLCNAMILYFFRPFCGFEPEIKEPACQQTGAVRQNNIQINTSLSGYI
jgi:hypothetical protein